jgi:hypothetical protein
MPKDCCSAAFSKHEGRCYYDATFYVHPFRRPSEGRFACTQHLGKIVRSMGEPDDTLSVVILGDKE